MATKRSKPEPLPDHLRTLPASREEVRVDWVRDGWYWGPACPQDKEHGALLDLKGSDKWYCRHQAHIGTGIYTETLLGDLEWQRITSSEQSQEISPSQL